MVIQNSPHAKDTMLRATDLERLTYVPLVLTISMFLVAAAFSAEPVWKLWNVDHQPISGSTNSCGFLPNGEAIIGFENRTKRQTRVARFNGQEWKIDSVADTNAEGVSLAVSPSGKIYLSSIDSRNRQLKLSVFDKDTWATEVIDAKNRYVGPTSVVLTAIGNPMVFAYSLGTSSLKAFMIESGSWASQNVAEPAGYEVSGAVSEQGLIACASMSENVPMLSILEGERWNHRQFEGLGNLKGPNALAFNRGSLPVFVVSGSRSEGLKLATFSDGKLATENIEAEISTSSASIDYSGDGHPVVAFIDRTDLFKGLLKVAKRTNGDWKIETVDQSAGGGWQTDVAWAPDGRIGVSYYDQESRTLKFALRAAPITE